MRDLTFLLGFIVMLFWGVRFPHVGVMLWAWTAMIVHTAYVYGFASAIPFNKIIAGITILGILMSSEKKKLPANLTFLLLVLFMFWGTISAFTSISSQPFVMDHWERFVKIITFSFAVVLIINTKSRIEGLLYAIFLSLGFHGVVAGAKFLVSGGAFSINGPGQSIIGDNNHFALAMVALLPVVIYLYKQAENRTVRYALMGSGVIVAVAVMGTFSRGGFLGITAVGLLALLRSKTKLKFVAALIPVVVLAVTFAPERWSTRMDSISDADRDNSFMGRVVAWKQSTLIALNNPVFGGGFHAVQDFAVWTDMRRSFYKLDFIPTDQPDNEIAYAAHSIYFEVLGDMGFGGLLIFLLIFFTSWRNAAVAIRLTHSIEELRWVSELSTALQYTLVAYVVSGAALSMAYFDYIYVVVALLIVLRSIATARVKLLSSPQVRLPGALGMDQWQR